MTSQSNSGLACGFVFAVAIIAMMVLPGSIGAGTVQQAAPAMDVSAMMRGPAIANLPDLTVPEPF